MLKPVLLLAGLALIAITEPVCAHSVQPPRLPDGIDVATPTLAGLHTAPLATLRKAVETGAFPNTTSVLILKDRKLVFEEYFGLGARDVLNDTRSATKSVSALMVGAALADGALKSVEEPAFRRLADLAPFDHNGVQKQQITLADLLTMSSALDCNDFDENSPGNEENMYPRRVWTRWAVDLPLRAGYERDSTGRGPFSYCTAGVVLLGQVVQRATGKPVDEYVNRRLLEPLGIDAREWPRSPSGEVMTGGGLRLRSRDLAKLALLSLAKGKWSEQQILPAGWIEEMWTVRRNVNAAQNYGYLYWQRQYRSSCGLIDGWYMSGNGGNAIVHVPSHALAVVITRQHYNQRGMHEQTIKLLEDHVFSALACTAGG